MIFQVAGAAAIGWVVGTGLSYVRQKLINHYAKDVLTPEQLERVWVLCKAAQITASRKRKQEHIFAIVMRCNVEASSTEQQVRQLKELHDEFIVAQAQGNAEDVAKLTDQLKALGIFKGKPPILSDDELWPAPPEGAPA
jgi:hypothetical protein